MARKKQNPPIKQKTTQNPLSSFPARRFHENRLGILGRHPPPATSTEPATCLSHSALVNHGREGQPQNEYLENINNGHNSNEWRDVLSRRYRRLLRARTNVAHGRISGSFIHENLGEKVWIASISSFMPSFASGANSLPLGERRNPILGASSPHRHLPQTRSRNGTFIRKRPNESKTANPRS
ncbi:hypothetical protein SUGI_0846140 [Cryptomeria japonica]|nr:hypothetical protein SUGI_0846140 [Cryptomeria japonica]